ncbi:hypothetical protein PFISCL1PPCAC_5199 [Pristionchus fissidentatus]|uniref:Secreted protein n=1 Tax=Pristionchus fissidentatus TaxID=1538716 RepID=A0AAV5V6J3_9BILA|nr:hypothetical protein PFISCL1PPCAC_5199 [Pristionchus fissidentatus]
MSGVEMIGVIVVGCGSAVSIDSVVVEAVLDHASAGLVNPELSGSVTSTQSVDVVPGFRLSPVVSAVVVEPATGGFVVSESA